MNEYSLLLITFSTNSSNNEGVALELQSELISFCKALILSVQSLSVKEGNLGGTNENEVNSLMIHA